MSWKVQTLLLNSEMISTIADIESDEFNDLIVLEAKIKEMLQKNLLTEEELKFLKAVSEYRNFRDSAIALRKARGSLTRRFINLCSRIGYYIGDSFTNEGYVDDLTNRYRLTNTQEQALADYIKSKYRYKSKQQKRKTK